MKKTVEKEVFICDCCGSNIHLPQVLRNDMSFQYNHITKNSKDLCLTCAALVLEDLEVSEEKLNESIENVKKRYRFRDKPFIELGDIFNISENNNK